MKKILLMAALCGTAFAFTSCSSQSKEADNPFFAEWNTPFGIPPFDQVKYEHFIPAYEEGFRLEDEEINAIVNNTEEPTFENVIEAYTNTGSFLSRVTPVFGAYTSSEMDDELRAIQQQLSPMQTQHRNAIVLNDALFAKVKAVYDKRESLNLTPEQMRLTEKVYDSFVSGGANLTPEQKTKLKQLNQDLSRLSMEFNNNLLKEMNNFALVIENGDDLAGLPEGVIEAAAIEANNRGLQGKWVFTLDKPSMIPFLQYADNRDLRQQLYTGYLTRCDHNDQYDNKAIVDSIVNLRLERAKLLGYDTYAAMSLENNMAKTPENVYALLNDLWTPALKRAKGELAEMKAIKVSEGQGNDFQSWDWWYYAEKLRKQKYDMDENAIRPYFSLETVRDGIFMVVKNLYGITFKEIPNAPRLNDECSTYEVLDKDGSHLGVLVMDMFPRKGKKVGAWTSSYRGQSFENGQRVAPISTITCNFTRPTGNAPALLTLDEVATFFHEFGHAMHTLVSQVQYKGLKGTSRDFVELPSQVMENWAMDPQVIKMYAKHYQTGEPIPDELVEKIGNSKLFSQGFLTVENLAASLLDMDYHTVKEVAPIDVTVFEDNANKGRGLIPEIAPRYRTPYFQHIFSGGYAAGYYSYMWAEVLDADAYHAFVETGDLFNPEVAEKFRNEVLAVGGSRDEMDSYRAFRGKDPDRKFLLERRGLL